MSSRFMAAALVVVLATAGVIWLMMSGGRGGRTVVVYTSVDQVVAEPILKAYETRTGVRVLAVYDVEATKTTGLVSRLIAERKRPQCDVFWNNELAQTLQLKQEGVLAAYTSPETAAVPESLRDADHRWFAVGGRMRVILVNTKLLKPEEYPKSIFDFTLDRIPGAQVAVSNPLFGTAAGHAAALYAELGPETALAYYQGLRKRGVRFVDGNSVVREMVSDGRAAAGITDSDDAEGAVRDGSSVKVIVPDQDGLGTLVFPGTASVIAGAPHEKEVGGMMAYLLSAEVERQLVDAAYCQFPRYDANRAVAAKSLGLTAPATASAPAAPSIRAMKTSPAAAAAQFPRMHRELSELLLR